MTNVPRGRGAAWASRHTSASLVVTVVTGSLLASVGVYDMLLSLSVSLIAAMSVGLNLAVITMRLREPGLARPYRMPLFPLPTVFAALVNFGLLAAFVYEDPATAAKGLAMVATIVVPAYAALRWRRRTHGGE